MFERDKEELRELGITVEIGAERPVLRRRAGLPHPPRRRRAARPRADPRGGRRHRAGHPGLGARRTRQRLDHGAGQAQGHRGRRRHQRAAHGRAQAVHRRAVVRRDVGRRHPPDAGLVRLRAPGARGHGAPPAAVGDHLVARPLVRRRIRPRPRGAAHLPPVPGHRRGRDDRAARLVRGARGHRHEGPRPRRCSRHRPTRRRCCASARGAASRCAGSPRQVTPIDDDLDEVAIRYSSRLGARLRGRVLRPRRRGGLARRPSRRRRQAPRRPPPAGR